ncbi:hypothetical protein N7540_001796 [Penicillium herquei]|nr:hypothetical protein N7540_001796 [Penicillium herquei]
MSEYVLYGHQVHPFFSTVVSAAVSHPVLMSAKILNASAWDDLMVHDKIEKLTFEQSTITRYLLSQTMDSRDNSKVVNLAALVAILLFDCSVICINSSWHSEDDIITIRPR